MKKEWSQKHTLNKTIKEVHQSFQDYTDMKISFSKCASLKPKNVETVNKKQFRGCLCEKCTNVELMLKTINKHLEEKINNNKI